MSQILAGSVLELKFGILDGPGPAIDFLLVEAKGNDLFEPNPGLEPFGAEISHLDGPGPAIEFLLWKQRETAFLNQILALESFKAQIWHFGRRGPAIEFLLWKQRETAFLSLLELKFGILDGPQAP